ncbi:hypothetical protein [Planctomycetes bacterium CA13]|uniref:hypothetical protein n=1 Tax=Novipirellula herctigrandis TaxID=2527986 RepID=UPI0011B4CD5A
MPAANGEFRSASALSQTTGAFAAAAAAEPVPLPLSQCQCGWQSRFAVCEANDGLAGFSIFTRD